MFHKIDQMYRDIRQQQIEEATEMILNLRANLKSNNTTSSSPITPKISIQQPTMPLEPKTVPKNLKEIQSRPSHVWNCAHGLPIDVNTLGVELQLVIKEVNVRQSTKESTPKVSSQYTRSVIN